MNRLALAVVALGLIGVIVALIFSRPVGVVLIGIAVLVGVALFTSDDDGGPLHPPPGTYG